MPKSIGSRRANASAGAVTLSWPRADRPDEPLSRSGPGGSVPAFSASGLAAARALRRLLLAVRWSCSGTRPRRGRKHGACAIRRRVSAAGMASALSRQTIGGVPPWNEEK